MSELQKISIDGVDYNVADLTDQQKGILSRAEIDDVAAKVRDQIRTAIQEATTAPDSNPEELLSSVFRAIEVK